MTDCIHYRIAEREVSRLTVELLRVDGLRWRKNGPRWQYQQRFGGWCDAPESFSPFLDRIAELQFASRRARGEIIECLEEATDSVWGRLDVIKKLLAELKGEAALNKEPT